MEAAVKSLSVLFPPSQCVFTRSPPYISLESEGRIWGKRGETEDRTKEKEGVLKGRVTFVFPPPSCFLYPCPLVSYPCVAETRSRVTLLIPSSVSFVCHLCVLALPTSVECRSEENKGKE